MEEGQMLPRARVSPLPPRPDEGGGPSGSRRAAATRGRSWPPSEPVAPPFRSPSDRGRSPMGSGRAAATRGSGGGLGPPPDHVLPLSHRDGRGGWGVRAAPVNPAARCGCHFRTDTYPCQAAAGEGEILARGRAKPSPAPPIAAARRLSDGAPLGRAPAAEASNLRGESPAPRTPGCRSTAASQHLRARRRTGARKTLAGRAEPSPAPPGCRGSAAPRREPPHVRGTEG